MNIGKRTLSDKGRKDLFDEFESLKVEESY